LDFDVLDNPVTTNPPRRWRDDCVKCPSDLSGVTNYVDLPATVPEAALQAPCPENPSVQDKPGRLVTLELRHYFLNALLCHLKTFSLIKRVDR
jgi:hypothetical protein